MGEHKDWKGWRFILVSLVVTTASIIFFFAERQIFNKIELARSTPGFQKLESLAQRVKEWGGVRLKSVDLQVVPQEPALESLALKVRTQLEALVGQPFWWLDIEGVKQRILSEGWPKSVYIRRAFPAQLKVQIIAREPRLLVKSASGWALVDEGGILLTQSKDISGHWASLPIVFGLEESFSRDLPIVDLNRQLTKEQEILTDLGSLLSTLKERVGIDPELTRISQEAWADEAVFLIQFKVMEGSKPKAVSATFLAHHWSERLEGFQFVLSDLKKIDSDSVKILGQFEGRWFVRKGQGS